MVLHFFKFNSHVRNYVFNLCWYSVTSNLFFNIYITIQRPTCLNENHPIELSPFCKNCSTSKGTHVPESAAISDMCVFFAVYDTLRISDTFPFQETLLAYHVLHVGFPFFGNKH